METELTQAEMFGTQMERLTESEAGADRREVLDNGHSYAVASLCRRKGSLTPATE